MHAMVPARQTEAASAIADPSQGRDRRAHERARLPHIVELRLPDGGFGNRLDEFEAFHRLPAFKAGTVVVSDAMNKSSCGGASQA
jgi:hypothetical protein